MEDISSLLKLKHTLRFHNGKFRILIFSDLHGVEDFDRRVVRDMEAVVKNTEPDLVIFNGDNVWRDGATDADSLRGFMTPCTAYLEANHIPWAHTFGNHDAEKGFEVCEQQKVFETYDYCLTKAGPDWVPGTGNCVLPILAEGSDDIKFNMWLLDSHRDMREYLLDHGLPNEPKLYKFPDPLHLHSGYDTIRFEQIMWYWQTSRQLAAHCSHPIPGAMAFHIAIPEFVTIYKNVAECRCRGIRRESVGNSPINSGLFNALFERQEVKTVVCGHDHINDYDGQYLGITLAMDGGMNYDGYCDDDIRGGRILDINEDDPWHINTYMVRSADYVADYPGKPMRKADVTNV